MFVRIGYQLWDTEYIDKIRVDGKYLKIHCKKDKHPSDYQSIVFDDEQEAKEMFESVCSQMTMHDTIYKGMMLQNG